MPERGAVPWIVTCRSAGELAAALEGVAGARAVRALDERRVVVLAPAGAKAQLEALAGVERVQPDVLLHPHHPGSTTGPVAE